MRRLVVLPVTLVTLVTLVMPGLSEAAPDPHHVEAIRAAGIAAKTWKRVDERPNIAPMLCVAPKPADWGTPSQVRMSKAAGAPHGKKLYYARASDPAVYLDAKAAIPAGFAIAKETFEAVASHAVHPPRDPHAAMIGDLPPIGWLVTDAGNQLATGKRAELFVMTKLSSDPRAPGTDAGWIYGAIAPDGTVLDAGPIASCMRCHTGARRDRLFGLPPP